MRFGRFTDEAQSLIVEARRVNGEAQRVSVDAQRVIVEAKRVNCQLPNFIIYSRLYNKWLFLTINGVMSCRFVAGRRGRQF